MIDHNAIARDAQTLARRCACETLGMSVAQLEGADLLLASITTAVVMGRTAERLQRAGRAPCRVCGCTQNRACEGGCGWAEPDLCTACVPYLPPAEA